MNFSETLTLLRKVRIEVTNGAKLLWEMSVVFDGDGKEDEQMNDGRAVVVGEGSTVHFFSNVEMTDIAIINNRDGDGDQSTHMRSGGCGWTDGHFRADGDAVLVRCDVTGIGESNPGPGRTIYVGTAGSVLFNGEVSITETAISDDFGGDGEGYLQPWQGEKIWFADEARNEHGTIPRLLPALRPGSFRGRGLLCDSGRRRERFRRLGLLGRR